MRINELLVLLLEANRYMTSNEISRSIGCSVRTVKSSVNDIERVCKANDLVLIRKKGKGYFIEGDSNDKKRLTDSYLQDVVFNYSMEERFLYILYVLLFEEDEKLTITELSEILYLSRPSVYKEITKLNEFLAQYDVKIMNHRKDGLKLEAGEKRKRLLITKWVNITLETVGNQRQVKDKLGLLKSLEVIMTGFNKSFFKQLILDIKEQISLDFSLHELDWLTHIFFFSVMRYKTSNEVTLTDSRIELIRQIDNEHIIHFIIEEIKRYYGLEIPEVEAIYLYTLLIVQSSEFPESKIQVSLKLYDDIDKYVDEIISIEEEHRKNLVDNIVALLLKEVNYQINNDYYSILIDYYKELESSFGITATMAKKIVSICTQYYSIRMTEQLICNIVFTISRVMEYHKKPLSTVLIHDCNDIELQYIKEKISKHISFIEIVDEMYESDNLDIFDIALSTKPYNHDDIPVVVFNKNINHLELDKIYIECNKLFQRINYLRLIKNTENVPDEVCK